MVLLSTRKVIKEEDCMKRFARCVLIMILVIILSGVGSYFYFDNSIKGQYESVSKLYVTPTEANEASIRAKDGGLNDDFMIIFNSEVVISTAQKYAGTTEDISEYLTVTSPKNSNIVELKVVNPDQDTAKLYVDCVAKAAVKTTSIIPVESIQILTAGTKTGEKVKPNLYRYTIYVTVLAAAVCLFIELIVCLFLTAFKKKEEFDDELEYERRFGAYAYMRRPELLETKSVNTINHEDILASIDEEYEVERKNESEPDPDAVLMAERYEQKFGKGAQEAVEEVEREAASAVVEEEATDGLSFDTEEDITSEVKAVEEESTFEYAVEDVVPEVDEIEEPAKPEPVKSRAKIIGRIRR